jgi:hypothetical protein
MNTSTTDAAAVSTSRVNPLCKLTAIRALRDVLASPAIATTVFLAADVLGIHGLAYPAHGQPPPGPAKPMGDGGPHFPH